MEEYITLMLGILSFVWYMAAFTFAFFGQVLLWGIQTYRSVRTNPNTPSTFSWSYWLRNNLMKKAIYVLIVFIAVFCGLRFAPEIFGTPATLFIAFLFGFSSDLLIGKIWDLRHKLFKREDTIV